MLFEELHIQICFGLNYNLENIDKSFSVNMHATHEISHNREIIKPQFSGEKNYRHKLRFSNTYIFATRCDDILNYYLI